VSRTFLRLPGAEAERRWRWRGERPALAAGSLRSERSRRRRARALGRAASDAPRAPGTASHLAQRSWAARARPRQAGRESNTFSLNFPAPVPANTHSRTHTRAPRASQRRASRHRGLSGRVFLSPSLLLARRLLFYLFISSSRLHPPPRVSLPALLLLLLPSVCETRGRCRSSCSVAGLRAAGGGCGCHNVGRGGPESWQGGAPPGGRGHQGCSPWGR
jgi:hypothetical protein